MRDGRESVNVSLKDDATGTAEEGVEGGAPVTKGTPDAGETCKAAAEAMPAAGDSGCAGARARITYRDCVMGRAPVPSDPVGFFVFHMLMVLGMVAVMATFNGVRSDGLVFLRDSHWVYPVVFCFAFFYRRTVANVITGFLIPRLVVGRLSGPSAGVAKSVINVGTMNPAVCMFVGLLVKGPQGMLAFFCTAEPLSLFAAIAVNYLLVGPAVKMFVNNHVSMADNVRILRAAHAGARPWSVLLGLS